MGRSNPVSTLGVERYRFKFPISHQTHRVTLGSSLPLSYMLETNRLLNTINREPENKQLLHTSFKCIMSKLMPLVLASPTPF